MTLALPDDVYRRARVFAAERDLSVSALVRDLLMGLEKKEDEFGRLERQQAEILAQLSIPFRASERLSREELYERKG